MLVLVATLVAGAVFVGRTIAFADAACARLDKGIQRIYIIHGQFTRGRPKVSYCFYALAGQHVLINIKPTGNLNTEGSVQFAGPPPKPDWSPGNPGGIVFNEALPWAGKYVLVVGQRFNEKKAGRFKVEISGD